MDGEQLRSLQNPLKARYRTEPAAALVTLHAADARRSITCGFKDVFRRAARAMSASARADRGKHDQEHSDRREQAVASDE